MLAKYDNGLVLNVRNRPNGQIVDQIASGTAFDVEWVEDGWLKIKSGYVNASFVSLLDGDDESRQSSPDEDISCSPNADDADDYEELSKMKIAELRDLAAASGIDVPSTVTKKADIIARIIS